MKNNMINAATDSSVFWNTAKSYLTHQLPDIQKASPNTVAAYRNCLNAFIDYLEIEKKMPRSKISFQDFSRKNIKDYLDWMLNTRKLADKTCNLRITAIHSLLEYAGHEYSTELMGIYLESCTVKCLKIKDKAIEYFETAQMKALLAAPDTKSRIGRRNQMMLILYYDTGARNSELLEATCSQLHLQAEVPYITILGKGRKYRNVPLMNKTLEHLKRYLKEFHEKMDRETPLFYAVTHGEKHRLSNDTVEKMIIKYSKKCAESGTEMPEKSICHMIRKTRAMDLYRNGMPLTHIQQLLGHENISTTSGFYAFATLDTLAKAMETANENNSTGNKKWADPETLKMLYRL